jgi:hypothetical protein
MRYLIIALFTTIGLLVAGGSSVSAAPANGFGDDAELTDQNNTIKIAGTKDGHQEDDLLKVVKGAVNWVLGILGLIALLFLMYGGFQMVTAAGDGKKYESGQKVLKAAAYGILLIGFAWLLVSWIFWLSNVLGTAADGTSAGTEK